MFESEFNKLMNELTMTELKLQLASSGRYLIDELNKLSDKEIKNLYKEEFYESKG